MNPYASQLSTGDPMDIIADTPGRLQALLATLGNDGTARALAPGKWSVREILCHLADTEVAFAVRLRQAKAEPHHVIQPFDQDQWASHYREMPVDAALECFTAVRNWNLLLLRTVPPETMAKPVTHPERGTMTFQTLVETMAGHDRNHLVQIEKLAG